MKVIRLRCEYADHPFGMDVLQPRLSWQLESKRAGAKQSAYQVMVRDLAQPEGGPALWDSGKVLSDQSLHIPYEGPALQSRQQVAWTARVWDENGRPTRYAPEAGWEMGLLRREDWRAQWIGAPFAGGARSALPAPYLRKTFTLGGEVRKARLYITALGLYEAWINGQRVGQESGAELTPGWTDYAQRVRYQVYDVTHLLQSGENLIGAILGDGWYCGNLEWRGRQLYGDRPRLLAQLEISYEAGAAGEDEQRMVIVSDRTWQTTFGPILESDLLMGESYDARRELDSWTLPGETAGEGGCWLPVEVFPAPRGMALTAQNGPLVKRQVELTPIAAPREIKAWPQSTWIFDLGQNMVGWVKLKVSGASGTTVRLRYAEMLNPDGSLYVANLRSARATDYYTLKGSGAGGAPAEETWQPRFTFHGFRYVELSGYPGEPTRATITGIVLHSDNPPTGSFECSEALINQLQHNIQWGWKGNSLDVPTDCPQRDERLGWTGDAQVFSRTAVFNTRADGFFAKWLQDLEDAQAESGALPPIAPNTDAVKTNDGGPAWADAGVIVPWTLYLAYHDTRLLAERYGMMTRFVDYLIQTSPGYIRVNQTVDEWKGVDEWLWGGFGDWLALDGSGRTDGGTPKDLIGAAFFAYSARLLSQIAAALGKSADAGLYEQLYQDVRAAFQRRFITPDGLVTGGTQTGYVLALAFDLLPPEVRQRAAIALTRDIKKKEMHLGTGFVGAHFLPFVLTDAGRLDLAYDLLFQKTWPSWLYAVTQGATTIWERWDGWTHDKGFQDPGMNSFNHYAYGAIGDWLYRVVAGINPDWEQPAYKHVIFRPQPPADGRLRYAKASLESPYGLVSSEWEIVGDEFRLTIQTPANTHATVFLPGETAGREMQCGKHRFRLPFKK